MTTFALVSEGMTDVAVIEQILLGCLGTQAYLNPVLPIRDATDRSRAQSDTFSNWELVLEFLASVEPIQALETNDFLIVQIDTDQAEHPNFGLEMHNQGTLKSIEEIVLGCREFLLNRLSKDFPNEWRSRIIFALPVMSTECWLIPIFDENHKHTSKKSINCETRLFAKIQRAITKEYKHYSAACKCLAKQKTLIKIADRTKCLSMFIDSLKISIK
jgi:hypothetical protein